MVESILNTIKCERSINIFLYLSEFLSATGCSSFCTQNPLPDDLTLNRLVDINIDICRKRYIYNV